MPLQSSVVTRPGCGPTLPFGSTSLMRSSSTTTAAPSTGSAPVQSIRRALVKTVIAMGSLLSRHDLGVVHPDLLVGAGRPLDGLGHAVEVVLLPQEHPGRLLVDQPLQLGVGLGPRLGIEQRLG